jgi:hypothetical protein
MNNQPLITPLLATVSYEIAEKPWTVSQFERFRPHMTSWVKENVVPSIEEDYRRILLRAPVKSGKREIAEYLAMRDVGMDSPRIHVFMSAWHRVADELQREELKEHNMKVFSLNQESVICECTNYIAEQIASEIQCVVHLDECDYGSGHNQIVNEVYTIIRNLPEVTIILYSATPEEALFSREMEERSESENELLDDMLFGTHVEYIPPAGYCGPGRFLDAGLIHSATPFANLNNETPRLTPQGLKIVQGLRQETANRTGRNIVVLRLSRIIGNGKKDARANKEIYIFLEKSHLIPELDGVRIWVSNSDVNKVKYKNKLIGKRPIEWDNSHYWEEVPDNLPILIVIDQTSTRSTEWSCHHRIFATHDFRTTIQYATISQAQERVNHYDTKYPGGFQPIHVYGHLKTFLLSAKRISYNDYFQVEWDKYKIDARRRRQLELEGNLYEIKNEKKELHPIHYHPLTEGEANDILIELGCGSKKIGLSSRVRGDVRTLPVFGIHWFECNADSFEEKLKNIRQSEEGVMAFKDCELTYNPANPFKNNRRPPPREDGMEHGYLRGWGVYNYEEDIVRQPGWGLSGQDKPRLTICYKEGVLGVALRWNTGEMEEMNRLTAYKSMYGEREINT